MGCGLDDALDRQAVSEVQEGKLRGLVESFSAKMLYTLGGKASRGWLGWSHRHRKRNFEIRLLEHAQRGIDGEAGQWIHVANFAAFLDRLENLPAATAAQRNRRRER